MKTNGSGGHIVVIEDNEATRYAVTRILANAGYRATSAGTGEAGIALVQQLRPDLVLLDVKLPDVNGFEIVRRLRSAPDTAAIPLVHLSATSISAAEQVRGLEGGADAYLTHPVEPRVLVATLNALLRARRAEARLRRVFDTGLLGIVTWDREGVVLDANDAFLRLVGWDRADVAAGRLRWAALAPDGAAPAQGAGAPAETALVGRDGTRVPVLVGRAPEDGQEDVAFVLDISERKRAEDALRDADRHKDEFLAILSHELRNPLAPIRNSAYILARAEPSSAQADRARQVIERQAEHLTRLVDDLLDVTRISRGKIELHRELVDLREVVRKTADDIRTMFDQSGVDLRIELDAVPLWIDADPTRIAQVVSNLLHNSMKFTPAGGGVMIRAGPAAGGAEVVVRDTGIGIAPADLEHVFEPFRQADRSLARSQGGLGLGLSLVLGMVRLHGGSISARSEGPGTGSEFRVTLPLAAPPDRAGAGARSGAAAGPRLVLVIEDNPDAAHSLLDVLETMGHRARVARDGETGISLARELRPDVVLCDIGLPDMDGYAVARALRADPALGATRLVAVTGYAQPEDRDRARDAGFDLHLPKPPPMDALDEILTAPAAAPA